MLFINIDIKKCLQRNYTLSIFFLTYDDNLYCRATETAIARMCFLSPKKTPVMLSLEYIQASFPYN